MTNKGRYKFDGKCPDCGAKVKEETEKTNNYWHVRRIYVDCPECGYMATANERKERKLTSSSWRYYRKQPEKWVFSETIPPSEIIRRDAEYMKQMADYVFKEVRKAIE